MKGGKVRGAVARWWATWGREFAVVLAVMIPFRSSVADWYHVPTGSMKPTILEGERVFVNKLAYDLKVPLTTWHLAEWDAPARGDVVVFRSPADGTRLIKRVIGLPGDTVAMSGNRLVINGEPLDYGEQVPHGATYLDDEERKSARFASERGAGMDHPVMALPARPAPRTFRPVTVPDGHYLMLGDNRDNSGDSRSFGFVPRKAILGRAPMVVASFDPDRGYLPRPGRWFRPMP